MAMVAHIKAAWRHVPRAVQMAAVGLDSDVNWWSWHGGVARASGPFDRVPLSTRAPSQNVPPDSYFTPCGAASIGHEATGALEGELWASAGHA